MTVEELFGRGSPAPLVPARPLAPLGTAGGRVVLAPVGDALVALPLSGATATRRGFLPAGGQAEAAAVLARQARARSARRRRPAGQAAPVPARTPPGPDQAGAAPGVPARTPPRPFAWCGRSGRRGRRSSWPGAIRRCR